ncbi:MAG: polysaccharide ABC transporter ATP-binding protein [Dysgonomonas sp.]
MSDTAITFDNISKQYRLGVIGTGTISHDLNRWWHRVRGLEDPYLKIGEVNDRSQKANNDYVWALRDISFDVKKGEVLGIIGKNGAGKSTLLKILSRVTSPTTGTIRAKGRIASLLEVGTGFHPEMTGRENIYMNGAIMGMTKAEITRKLDEIVAFAGVEKYIDTPVKRYSSGMTVRLGFAIAAHLEPEILVVDEVLAVGDAEFQKKAIGKMQDVSKGEGRTVLFVSHNMGSVAQLCTKAILLQNGTVAKEGDVPTIINAYLQQREISTMFIREEPDCNKPVYLKKIYLTDGDGKNRVDFMHDEPIYVNFELGINDPQFKCNLFVQVIDNSENKIFACESDFIDTKMRLKIEPLLVRGEYMFEVFVNVPQIMQVDVVDLCCPFTIMDKGSIMSKHTTYNYGFVFANYSWTNGNK